MIADAGTLRLWSGFTPSLEEMLGTGELLAICGALSATAIGDILAAKRRPTAKNVCVPVCGSVLFAAILWYCIVGIQIHEGKAYDKELVVSGSIALYIMTAITAAFCVALSDEK